MLTIYIQQTDKCIIMALTFTILVITLLEIARNSKTNAKTLTCLFGVFLILATVAFFRCFIIHPVRFDFLFLPHPPQKIPK